MAPPVRQPGLHERLPPDLWYGILQFLPVSSVATVAGTNRALHRLASTDAVWQHLAVAQLCDGDPGFLPKPGPYPWLRLAQLLHGQKESLLSWRVTLDNGGSFSEYYNSGHLVVNDGRVYCSKKPRDVTLMLVPTGTPCVVVSQLVAKVPSFGFTSPVRSFGVVLTPGPPVLDPTRYDATFASLKQWARTVRPAATLTQKGPVLYAHFTGGQAGSPLDPQGSLMVLPLPSPRACGGAVVRLYEGAEPENNIDMQFMGFAGRLVPVVAHPE
eukprot:RCo012356